MLETKNGSPYFEDSFHYIDLNTTANVSHEEVVGAEVADEVDRLEVPTSPKKDCAGEFEKVILPPEETTYKSYQSSGPNTSCNQNKLLPIRKPQFPFLTEKKRKTISRKRHIHHIDKKLQKIPVVELEKLPLNYKKLLKINMELSAEADSYAPGRLVWGYVGGWYPAIVINGADAGVSDSPDKNWVCWLGELKISQLSRKSQLKPFGSNFVHLVNYYKNKWNNRNSTFKMEQRNQIYLATIQLLRKHFETEPITKPFDSWLLKELQPYEQELDEILLYPYPKDVSEQLSFLKNGSRPKSFINKSNSELYDTNENKAVKQKAETITKSPTVNNRYPMDLESCHKRIAELEAEVLRLKRSRLGVKKHLKRIS